MQATDADLDSCSANGPHGRMARRRVVRRSPISLSFAIAATAALLLAGCSKHDDGQTTGQKVDEAIATTKQAGTELAGDAARAVDKASKVVVRTSKDIAITADVNASLARDETLSALAINVDTASGHVVLKGNAPDEASRARATQIAKAVDGVKEVDNQLQIKTVN